MTDPAQPVEATPRTDAEEATVPMGAICAYADYIRMMELARSLERELSLAQTENAGHIRIEDELKAELGKAQRWLAVEREKEPEVYRLRAEVSHRQHEANELRARCAELEKSFERVERELAYLLRT